jgi:hypothetical protein
VFLVSSFAILDVAHMYALCPSLNLHLPRYVERIAIYCILPHLMGWPWWLQFINSATNRPRSIEDMQDSASRFVPSKLITCGITLFSMAHASGTWTQIRIEIRPSKE